MLTIPCIDNWKASVLMINNYDFDPPQKFHVSQTFFF